VRVPTHAVPPVPVRRETCIERSSHVVARYRREGEHATKNQRHLLASTNFASALLSRLERSLASRISNSYTHKHTTRTTQHTTRQEQHRAPSARSPARRSARACKNVRRETCIERSSQVVARYRREGEHVTKKYCQLFASANFASALLSRLERSLASRISNSHTHKNTQQEQHNTRHGKNNTTRPVRVPTHAVPPVPVSRETRHTQKVRLTPWAL